MCEGEGYSVVVMVVLMVSVYSKDAGQRIITL